MALQTKKKWAQLKVGLLAIAALSLLAFLIFLMTSTKGLFVSRSDVYTFLDDSAAIAQGAPVRLNGIAVGRVSAVTLSGSAEPNRVVRVTLQVNNDYLAAIPVDSQAAISSGMRLACSAASAMAFSSSAFREASLASWSAVGTSITGSLLPPERLEVRVPDSGTLLKIAKRL